MTATTAPPPGTTWRERFLMWEWLLAGFGLVVIVVGIVTTPGFATAFNVESSMSRFAPQALLALPLVFLIIMREIDISVASVAGLAGIVLGMASEAGAPLWLGIVAALALGIVSGAVNAGLVVGLGLPSLVVTLGTLALFRGLCYVLVGGSPISDVPSELITITNGSTPGFPIPWPTVPFIILAAAAAFVLHGRPVGKRIFAIGGSPDTARYSGVRSRRIVATTFVLSGLVAGLAGIILVGLTSSASPDAGLGFELDAVTIVFLGGISFLGGKGRMGGVVAALLVVVAVKSMLLLNNWGAFGQSAMVGAILIGSLLAANVMQQRANARLARRTRESIERAHESDPDSPDGSDTDRADTSDHRPEDFGAGLAARVSDTAKTRSTRRPHGSNES